MPYAKYYIFVSRGFAGEVGNISTDARYVLFPNMSLIPDGRGSKSKGKMSSRDSRLLMQVKGQGRIDAQETRMKNTEIDISKSRKAKKNESSGTTSDLLAERALAETRAKKTVKKIMTGSTRSPKTNNLWLLNGPNKRLMKWSVWQKYSPYLVACRRIHSADDSLRVHEILVPPGKAVSQVPYIMEGQDHPDRNVTCFLCQKSINTWNEYSVEEGSVYHKDCSKHLEA